MNKKTVSILTFAMLGALSATAQQKTALSYWFDTPVTRRDSKFGMEAILRNGLKRNLSRLVIPPAIRIRIGSQSHCLSVTEASVPISWDR